MAKNQEKAIFWSILGQFLMKNHHNDDFHQKSTYNRPKIGFSWFLAILSGFRVYRIENPKIRIFINFPLFSSFFWTKIGQKMTFKSKNVKSVILT